MIRPRLRRTPAVVVLGWLAASAAPAEPVESSIDRVTIYPNQLARVERVAEVSPASATGTLAFADLPASIIDDSVRLAVESGPGELGAVETARAPAGEPPRQRERELRQQIRELRHQREAARDRAEAARAEIRFIDGLAKLPEGENAAQALAGPDAPARWQKLWERIGTGARAARQRLRSAEREVERLDNEIKTLQKRLDQLGQSRPERVTIRADYSRAESTMRVRLSYRLRGPRWTPTYAARLDTEAGEIRLERKARVAQATGEDWRDVELRLATVRPVQGERPQPSPWWIDLAPEREASGDGAALNGGTETMARASEPSQDKGQSAQTVNAAFAATYVVPGRVRVSAGNEPKTVQLGTDKLTAEVGVEIFPQQQQRAWLTGRTQWSGEGPLPPGTLNRYRDGAFVGRGRLAGWAPGEERRLSFGTDPRVDVGFEPLVDQSGERGWITSESTRARRYRLEVTNHHQRSLAVTALFRIPVPRNEAITVERHFSEPPSSENVDDKQGVHAWRTQLGAGSSIAWTLGYTVSYPEGRRLRGL